MSLLKRLLKRSEPPPQGPSVGGRRATLPAGLRLYAIGDVHGRADLLAKLEERIVEDAASARPGTRLLVLYVGDFVDRGLDSRAVLDHLIERPLPGFARVHLIGNHDMWLLDFLDDANVGRDWLQYGGDATLVSYGVRGTLRLDDQKQLETARRAFAEAVPKAHVDFLNALKLRHRQGDYLFVHAGIRPGIELAAQMPHDLLYIREPFLSDTRDHGLVVVHGHTVSTAPVIRGNRIGIDTGACWTGRLTALVLEGDEHRFLSTGVGPPG